MPETNPPQPASARPLSLDDQDDRIRAVFGLGGADALPPDSDECQRTYFQHLKVRLSFPFAARYADHRSGPVREVTVTGMCDEFPVDEGFGVVCNVRERESRDEVSLSELQLDDDHPNCQLVEDYIAWFVRALAAAEDDFDDDWDEPFEEEGDGDDFPEDGPSG
jgi:hypothetical protein